MKKYLLLLMSLFITAGSAFAAPPIDISYDDGIYHIILKGEKIKKQIKFVSSYSLITNKEAPQKTKSR